MARGYSTPPRVLLCSALAACNIDKVADDFFIKDPTHEPGGASSSTGPAGDDSSSSGADASSGTASAGADAGTSTDETSSSSDPGTSSEGTDTSTGAPTPVCGDGVIDPPEECEDPGDIHCFNCYRDRYVFVTSETFWGDFAASSGNIDYWCSHLAAVAGLQGPFEFRFKPWISTSDASAADRLFHSPGRYLLVNDLVFAESWDDLVAGNILNPLTVTEKSETLNAGVWTDTRPDGTAILPDGGNHCGDWTDDTFFTNHAFFGVTNQTDADWTLFDDIPEVTPRDCGSWAALYCFESL